MREKTSLIREAWAVVLIAAMMLLGTPPVLAENGEVLLTPFTPMELPIEVEIELSPAGSLKQAPLWKELIQLLEDPYAFNCTDPTDHTTCTATIERRPGFGVPMPALDIYPPYYNFLTAQPMRLRTSDGEVSWDQPGPLFDTDESCLEDTLVCDPFNTPTELRTVVGHLVACPDVPPGYQAATLPEGFCDDKPEGSLVVYNFDANPQIPPDGTVVAIAAWVDGTLHELEGGVLEEVVDLEAPVNEKDFFRDPADTTAVPTALRPYIGRLGAEVLGKAFFWDMQVGSDGVQACGSCHFHAGVDNRTRNQLNPDTLNADPAGNMGFTLEVASVAGSPTTNVEVVASDFPFHRRFDPDMVGDGVLHPAQVESDANDVMSSMGVSRFTQFQDIPPIGIASFLPAVSGVRALAPDLGTPMPDPVAIMQGVRRIEPRHTPTFHGAAFNFDNFWDVRARFAFNGGSVFGASDPTAHIFVNPGLATAGGGAFTGATMGHLRPDLEDEDPEVAEQPVRIKFSSLASQAVGPPLSEFEMSFLGRNWAKIGKKLLQGDAGNIQNQGNGAPQQPATNRENAVVPLANQRVATDDSRLGPFSNQGGSVCHTLGRPTAVGKPGLCISYPDLIRLAFARQFWNRSNRHLNGASDPTDPFDAYSLSVANGAANPNNTNQFSQMEANFSLFFGLSVQAYESLTIPDHTLVDQFFDANPNAGHGVGEPGDQAVLFPTLIPDLLDDGQLNSSGGAYVNLVPGFGPDELFGLDLFMGANLTAALAPGHTVGESGRDRNPLRTITTTDGDEIQVRVGSNPFTRSAKCMLCHLGAEQTDHSINVAHGLLKNDAEFEYPTPPYAIDTSCIFGVDPFVSDLLGMEVCTVPAPEPSGSSRTVPGLILAEEVGEGAAQDAVEVEPRDFATFDLPFTPWDDRVVGQESSFAFGDQGVYNIGLRPIVEDIGRGGDDPFGWPLSLAALTLINIAGDGDGNPATPAMHFDPCDGPLDSCVMGNVDPFDLEATFEETGDGALYPGTSYDLQSVNPGFERDPIVPLLPEYMVPWIHSLPAGELHPQIDEMAGMVPNTVTPPNGGPGIEFPEILFGADFHCAFYDPAQFGFGPPNFGWGAPSQDGLGGPSLCPQNQSGVAGNHSFPSQGTWPVANRVIRNGAFKAPPLRNVELTGPYFHTGSYLTLRQVVDFYMRGGDFPLTNAANRDPNINDLNLQTFSFGRTTGADLLDTVNHVFSTLPPFTLAGTFADGLPDTVFLYDEYPDSDHPFTPEPVFGSRAAALEDAKDSLVKFLLALTDPRVKFERAPFDRPELFVPIDGAAPENAGGPAQLLAQSGVACPMPGPGSGPTVPCFRHIPAVGAGGNVAALPNFLGVSSTPLGTNMDCASSGGANCDHFDRQ